MPSLVLSVLAALGLLPEEIVAVASAIAALMTIIKCYQFIRAAHRV
jgi:hypothetical protein